MRKIVFSMLMINKQIQSHIHTNDWIMLCFSTIRTNTKTQVAKYFIWQFVTKKNHLNSHLVKCFAINTHQIPHKWVRYFNAISESFCFVYFWNVYSNNKGKRTQIAMNERMSKREYSKTHTYTQSLCWIA